jgi:DNA-binding MurR/RpiR family transcriptional regulator
MELVIIILLEYIKENPNSEAGVAVAKILVQNLEKITKMSLESAADFCLCSPSTFSRFLKSLGIANFKELKKMVSSPRLVFHTDHYDKDGYAERVQKNINEIKAIADTVIKDIVLDLYNAKRVIFLAFPTNYAHLVDFQCKMMMNRKYIEVFSKQQMDDEHYQIDEGDLVFVISYQGNFFVENSTNKKVNTKNAKKILITQTPNISYSDFYKVIKCGSYNYYGEGSYALLFLLDRIYQEYSKFIASGVLY